MQPYINIITTRHSLKQTAYGMCHAKVVEAENQKSNAKSDDQDIDKILDNFSEPALIQATEANLFELIKNRRQWPRTEVRDDPEMLSCFIDVPYPHFNLLLRAKLSEAQVDSTIQSAIERCIYRTVPMGWLIGPSTTPATLAESLLAGFRSFCR